jgi:hypothetical protein
MSGMDEYLDPDLSFLDGSTGSDIAAVGQGIDEAATKLEAQTRDIAGSG